MLREAVGSLRASTRYEVLRDCDVVVICVPTPLRDHDPDLGHIEAAGEGIARELRPGMLVILESTTYPGTTEEILRPILADLYRELLGGSPDRVAGRGSGGDAAGSRGTRS